MFSEMDTIMPIAVARDRRLEPSARLLYGIIFTMALEHGYCISTNRELSFHLRVSEGRVSFLLGKLEHLGYIEREMICDPKTQELMERKLKLTKQPWTEGCDKSWTESTEEWI